MSNLDLFDPNNYEFNSDSKIGIYLIHGFSSTTSELKQIANFLSDKGYHIVLNNLPGHGTTVDDCNNTKFQEWLDYSKVEFAKLCSKSDKVFIIGHSMGGVVALHLATIFPVTGLILGGVVLKFKLFYFTNYINRFLCKIIKHREKKLTFEKSIRDSIIFYGYKAYPLIALEQFRKMNLFVKKDLHKVNSPTLIIHSKNDQVSIKENVDIIKESISSQNIDFFEMIHAPHSLFRINEESDLLFKACSDFIKKNI